MPLDVPQYNHLKLPGQTFSSFVEMQEACKDLPEEEHGMYKVSHIPQDPDPEVFMWDLK